MSVDYGILEFAAPRCCGAEWFDHAMWMAGVNGPRVEGKSNEPFQAEATARPRVSTVCHPCLWVELNYWFSLSEVQDQQIAHARLVGFLSDYFRTCRGDISRMFRSYEADAVMRLEDQPAAIIELLGSMGVKPPALRHLRGPSLPPRLEWKPEVRAAFLAAEKEVCERYDYF